MNSNHNVEKEHARSAAHPFSAVHLGRMGEVSGGMTQVVNSYLEWPHFESAVSMIPTRSGKRSARNVLLWLRAGMRLICMKEKQRTVVIGHVSQGGSFVREGTLLKLAKMLGMGTVSHLHGGSFVSFSYGHARLARFVLESCNAVIVLTDETRSRVQELVPNTKVELIQNAVSNGRPVSKKEKLVVFGGRVGEKKGVDVLLKAWKGLDSDGWRLVLAGPVQEDMSLEGAVHTVDVVGAISHESLMNLLDRSAIAVLPSRDEQMPMFILEALARKNAVVATRVGGIPSVLANDAGILTSPGDEVELRAALSSLLHDSSRRESIARAGHRVYATRFSSESVFPRVEACWKSALPESRKRK